MALDPKIWDDAPPADSPEFVEWSGNLAVDVLSWPESEEFMLEVRKRRSQAIRNKLMRENAS